MPRLLASFSLLFTFLLAANYAFAAEGANYATVEKIFDDSSVSDSQMQKALSGQVLEATDLDVAFDGANLAESIAKVANLDLNEHFNDGISNVAQFRAEMHALFEKHRTALFDKQYDAFTKEASALAKRHMIAYIVKNQVDSYDLDTNIVNVFTKALSTVYETLVSQNAPVDNVEDAINIYKTQMKTIILAAFQHSSNYRKSQQYFLQNIRKELVELFQKIPEGVKNGQMDRLHSRFAELYDVLKDSASADQLLFLFSDCANIYHSSRTSAPQEVVRAQVAFLSKVFESNLASGKGSPNETIAFAKKMLEQYFAKSFGDVDSGLKFCNIFQNNFDWNFAKAGGSSAAPLDKLYRQVHMSQLAYCLVALEEFVLSDEHFTELKQNIGQIFEVEDGVLKFLKERPEVFLPSNVNYIGAENSGLFSNLFNLYKRTVGANPNAERVTNMDLLKTLEALVHGFENDAPDGTSAAPVDLPNYYVLMKLLLTISGVPDKFTLNFANVKHATFDLLASTFDEVFQKLNFPELTNYVNNLFLNLNKTNATPNKGPLDYLRETIFSAEVIQNARFDKKSEKAIE